MNLTMSYRFAVPACLITVLLVTPLFAQTKEPSQPATAPATTRPGTEAEKVVARVLELLSTGKQADAYEMVSSWDYTKHADRERVLFLAAILEHARGDISASLMLFSDLSELPPDRLESQCARLVLLLRARREVEKNFAALLKIVEANPDKPHLRWLAAMVALARGMHEEGIRQCKMLLERWKPAPPSVRLLLGRLYQAQGKLEEALAEFDAAVKQSRDWESLAGYGMVLAKLKKYQESADALAEADRLAPDNPNVIVAWSRSLMMLGKHELAAKKLDSILAMAPDYPPAVEAYAEMLEREGKPAKAIEKYRELLRFLPEHEKAKSEIKRLEATMESKSSK